ncbi:unnamed protein product [Didymodactylos carnosus]|uniref:Ketoreductase domain-containing protein n=1 Tax=Didymodactylos carnosus TaxID=1234261 RepID=A0A8S2EWS5_9BILA|nr:unnamed protein product [Didymodactylos carnosus]CAF4147262.1 unnamed protein product [Didymodactylos carnosus]
MSQRVVLVTGAAGGIGKCVAELIDKKKYKLRLMIRSKTNKKQTDAIGSFGEIVEGTLDNFEGLKQVFAGVDTIIHLAGVPDANATWESLRAANIDGAYNVFVAARAAGVKRVVFASSIHAISGSPRDFQAKTYEPVNPGDLYGVTKCFGEALARYMAEQEGLSAIAVRIGAFQPHASARKEDGGLWMMDAWLSQRDCVHLFECCIDAPADLKFAIVHGLSKNTFQRMDITDTCHLLGYKPQDNFTSEYPSLKPYKLEEKIVAHNVWDPEQKSGLRDQLPTMERDGKKK